MARARKLKVFRTPIGFHDAYVAAPSRKAALAAWGADRDLFARGAAEEVTDPALTTEPLQRPGEVVRRSRGTAAEQLAASPARKRAAHASAPKADEEPARRERKVAPPPPPLPRPDRTALDEAEAALEAAARATRAVARDYDEREAALARERRAAEREARAEEARAERAKERAAAAYDRAMREWRER